MTRPVTLVGFALLAAAIAAAQTLGLRRGTTATLGQVLARARRSTAGRCLLLAGWLWLGWHLFVRADYR
jgi:uncharacterized protein DUF6186